MVREGAEHDNTPHKTKFDWDVSSPNCVHREYDSSQKFYEMKENKMGWFFAYIIQTQMKKKHAVHFVTF